MIVVLLENGLLSNAVKKNDQSNKPMILMQFPVTVIQQTFVHSVGLKTSQKFGHTCFYFIFTTFNTDDSY